MYTLDDMKKLAAKGKVSRRDFVQFAVAAGATVGMAETLFTTAQASEPKRGGHLRMGLRHGSTTDSMNPWYYPDSSTQTMFWGCLSNSLTQVDANGDIVYDLAESIEFERQLDLVGDPAQGCHLPRRQAADAGRRDRQLQLLHARRQ